MRRDFASIEILLQKGLSLTGKSEEMLRTIKMMFEQQEEMYREKKHQVEDRIVSIHQPWVRPIVRGKTNAPAEFGQKSQSAWWTDMPQWKDWTGMPLTKLLPCRKAQNDTMRHMGVTPSGSLPKRSIGRETTSHIAASMVSE